jgi:hypothetical protein
MLKKLPFTFFLLCIFCGSLIAQEQFGFGGHIILAHALKEEINGTITKKPVQPGLRVEVMKTKLGINRFRLSYMSFAASYIPYPKEDISVYANGSNGYSDTTYTGVRKGTNLDGMVRLGFEIRQPWSEFLFFNIGFGGGVTSISRSYDIPGFDSQKYFVSGFQTASLTEKGFGLLGSEFVSVYYEVAKFYFFFQAELVTTLSEKIPTEFYSTRLNFGIYYALHKGE